MTTDLQFTQEGHIGIITLSRPQALNALTLSMIQAMQQQLHLWQQDDAIHAVVVQAEQGKAFCAGGDVRWLYETGITKSPEQLQFFWHEYRLNHFIHQFKKPYIALMNGITMGGGVGISLHGSHPVASENFSFAMPETGIGFFPDIGASYLLARCPGEMGIYLGLTGSRLNAGEAMTMGLVNRVVAAEDFPRLVETLIESDLSEDASRVVNHCLDNYAISKSDVPIERRLNTINSCFNGETVELIISALHAKDDIWCEGVANQLSQKSPLSLKITLEQIRRAKSMTMAECIKMDYCLVEHFMRDYDFYEGVRALLVDKDKSPKWRPNSLERVTDAKVGDYFECEQACLLD